MLDASILPSHTASFLRSPLLSHFASLPLPAGVVSFPELPSSLSVQSVVLDGVVWVEARIAVEGHKTAPIFLTQKQFNELIRCIRERPSKRQQLEMIVGTIKSGKSTLLGELLPSLISMISSSPDWPSDRGRPVIFHHRFPLGADAETAAVDLRDALARLGHSIGIPFSEVAVPRKALNTLPADLKVFSREIRKHGGELWLLLDELQAPILASTPAKANFFTQKLKDVSW